MNDPLPITPFQKPLSATVALPGSKSITNRALILAALAEGKTRLEGTLFSRDTRIMIAALNALGFAVSSDEAAQVIEVEGQSGTIPTAKADIEVGNAGTAARFLTALLALHPNGEYRLDGDPAMRERPMQGLTDALTALGAADFIFHEKPGHFPFTMQTHGYRGGEVKVDASASSQILSALILAAPAGSGRTQLICDNVRPSYVAITLAMREAFGAAAVVPQADTYTLDPTPYQSPSSGRYVIEPDISAASYFLALATLHGGHLVLPHLGPDPLQGDARFAEVLAYHGLSVEPGPHGWEVEGGGLASASVAEIREIDFRHFSDTFLTYAAIAPLLGKQVSINGIGHTRHQETDRVAGMARELADLGQLVAETENSLTIEPNLEELRARAMAARRGGQLLTVQTYEDHRFAMSFGILGTVDILGDAKPWLAITDPMCCGKTFPGFFDVLNRVRPA